MWRVLILLPLLVACAPRNLARIGNDPGGKPVMVAVRYDPAALPALAQHAGFQRTVIVERDPWHPWFHHRRLHSPLHCPPYGWYGGPGWSDYAYEPSTTLFLLMGRGPAESQLLRLELREREWKGTILIAEGSEVVVSLQGNGGRSGWKEIGRFTARAELCVTVHLIGAEAKIDSEHYGRSP
jgi:hypothetical protein